MGNLCLPVNETNREIERRMSEENNADLSQKKLLFLGAGGAGKSTIFKQLKTIHNNPMNEAEKNEHVEAIRTDLVLNMRLLIRKSEELYNANPNVFASCQIDMSNESTAAAVSCIRHAVDYASPGSEIVEQIQYLWDCPCIQSTWKNRQYFAMSECARYFFDNIDRVCKLNYRPTEDDLLLARVRTTGIIMTAFDVNGHEFLVVDVGGQRNERKKWEHCFDDVTAVIFVASLSSYCEVLFEDERKNGMLESLELFESVANGKTFGEKDIILFLNKYDLFQERIADGKMVNIAFGDSDEPYRGTMYDPENEVESSEEVLENCIRESLLFIQAQYSDRKDHKDAAVYIHITTATDRGKVEKVFWDVQNIVLRGALKRGHLL